MRRLSPPVATLLIFAITTGAAPWVIGKGGTTFLFEAFLMLSMAQLWNLMAGFSGLVSLGLQCFVGIGAYVAVFASNELSISPYWALPLAAAACGVVAAASTLLLFRLRDAYFAISTWVFAEIVGTIVLITPGLGYATGLTLQTGSLIDFDTFLRVNFWLSALVAATTVSGIYLLMKSRVGLGMLTVRDNETAARSIGVDVTRNRFFAYVVAAAGCGLVGGLSFVDAMFVTTATAFNLNWVVAMIFIVIIGGVGTIEGPIVGTIVLFAVREVVTNWIGVTGSWYLIALGLIAVATMLVTPRGIWPAIRDRYGVDWLSIRKTRSGRVESSTASPAQADD